MPAEFTFITIIVQADAWISICHSCDVGLRLNLSPVSASTFLVHVDVHMLVQRLLPDNQWPTLLPNLFVIHSHLHHSDLLYNALQNEGGAVWVSLGKCFFLKLVIFDALKSSACMSIHSSVMVRCTVSPFTTFKHAPHQPADLQMVAAACMKAKALNQRQCVNFDFVFHFLCT